MCAKCGDFDYNEEDYDLIRQNPEDTEEIENENPYDDPNVPLPDVDTYLD
jgi:hypothetical protein